MLMTFLTALIFGLTQVRVETKVSMLLSRLSVTRMELLQTRKAENLKTYEQLTSGNDAKSLYLKNMQDVATAEERYRNERDATDVIRHDTDIMQGRHDYYLSHIKRLEEEQSQLSNQLDHWMHGFNLQHPPVHLSELDEVFADGKDWSQLRSSLKQINTDMLLCQAKVDDLNSRIIALDTEEGHCSTSSPDIQADIAAKQQMLTEQRNETLKQIARLAIQLEDHEKAVAAERNSAEPDVK